MSYEDLAYIDEHNINYVYISGRGYDGSEVGYSEYSGAESGYFDTSYCDRNGYITGAYSYEDVERIFKDQYDLNVKSLIIKFYSRSELNEAKEQLFKNDNEVLNEILRDLGYFGNYTYTINEGCKTILIYIE